jgi:hypothetical protein
MSISNPSDLSQMTLLSSNGWTASSDPNEIGVKSYPVKGSTIKLRCASKCAPLLVGFAAEFHALIEPIDEGTLDDWSYTFRMIRGSRDRLSNHASGTAIDLNATKHPLGKVGTFPSEKVPMIRALAKKYGLRWGGDYTSRADEMHFEINLSEAKVAALIGSLKLGDKDEQS